MDNKTFLTDQDFNYIVQEIYNYCKNIDGTYTADDFTADNEGTMDMILTDLQDNLECVFVDDFGDRYGLRYDLQQTAEHICLAVHEKWLIQELIEYINENVEQDDIDRAWVEMAHLRCPLSVADKALYEQINDLVDDFTLDNDLEGDWLYDEVGIDVNDIFEQL